MNILCWTSVIPGLAEHLARTSGSAKIRSRVNIQIESWEKASEYSGAFFDQIFRSDGFDITSLRSLVSSQRKAGPLALVVDAWGLLLAGNLEDFLDGLRSQPLDHLIVVGPRMWEGTWFESDYYHGLDLDMRRSFYVLFKNARRIFEAAWNGNWKCHYIQSAPTKEFLELLAGRHQLFPLTRMNIAQYPKEILNHDSAFSKVTHLSDAVHACLNEQEFHWGQNHTTDALEAMDGPDWLVTVNAEQRLPAMRQQSSVLQIMTDMQNWAKSCSWQSYVIKDPNNSCKILKSPVTLEGTKLQRYYYAAWLHYLAVLEQKNQNSSVNLEPHSDVVSNFGASSNVTQTQADSFI